MLKSQIPPYCLFLGSPLVFAEEEAILPEGRRENNGPCSKTVDNGTAAEQAIGENI